MVKICEQDTEFSKALAAFLTHERGVKVAELTHEEFEEIGNRVKDWMKGDEAEMTSALWFRASRHHRLKTQASGLFQFWCLLNLYLFWSAGFNHLFSWQAVAWLIAGTALVSIVVGFVGAAMENMLGLLGIHYKLVRGIKYAAVFLVCAPVFHWLFGQS